RGCLPTGPAVASGCGREAPPPATDTNPTNLPGIATDILRPPSLALLSHASWKTHCDGRAFFIARSILNHKRLPAVFFRKCRKSDTSEQYRFRPHWGDSLEEAFSSV